VISVSMQNPFPPHQMRDLVTNRWFLFRNKVDKLLYRIAPCLFVPLYTMVTFSKMPYAEVVRREHVQNFWVRDLVLLNDLSLIRHLDSSASTNNPLQVNTGLAAIASVVVISGATAAWMWKKEK